MESPGKGVYESFVPNVVKDALQKLPLQQVPQAEEFQGAVLFIGLIRAPVNTKDISGFTSLSEFFGKQGPIGSEMVTKYHEV